MIESARAVLTEEEWWDQYGDLHERIWLYDEYLTELVRGGYLADMEQFLFCPNGRLLEFGCGTGWVGLRIAQKGMALDGVDISAEQIMRARRNAASTGISNVRFLQGGVERIPTDVPYDGVILHALLHHLSENEIRGLFARLAQVLRPGGRIYAYEPVAAKPCPPVDAWMLDKGVLMLLRLLRALVFYLHLQTPEVRQAIRAGWTMQSPGEGPLDIEHLTALLPRDLEIVTVTYQHMCAVAYANICMELEPVWRRIFSRCVPYFIWLDRCILRPRWQVYFRAWPMVGIKMRKKSGNDPGYY